ncbi:MAG TPA: LamG-like jellyroll fold domain-containing protein, partial [Pseudonocardiaceae bacterium]
TSSGTSALCTCPNRKSASILGLDGTTTSGFTLQYDATDNRWAFTMPTTDTTTPTQVRALSNAAPTTGTWTHLVGTYNATTHTLALYINGTLTGTATNTTPINATGTLAIGRGQTTAAPTDYFPGTLSNIAAWNYTLTPTQITALYQQVN